MFDAFMKSEEIMEFLRRTGLKDLASQHKELLLDTHRAHGISIECYGTIDNGVVVVSDLMGVIVACERIHAESAARTRNIAFNEATVEELASVLLFLKLVHSIADGDGRFKDDRFVNWLDLCIGSAKAALKAKL